MFLFIGFFILEWGFRINYVVEGNRWTIIVLGSEGYLKLCLKCWIRFPWNVGNKSGSFHFDDVIIGSNFGLQRGWRGWRAIFSWFRYRKRAKFAIFPFFRISKRILFAHSTFCFKINSISCLSSIYIQH